MAVLTLFTHPECIMSAIIRFVLAEKGVELREVNINTEPGKQLAASVFGQATSPALQDHHVLIVDFEIMIEYIEERYPHPTMMPVSPPERATTRIFLRRLLRDLYPLLEPADRIDRDEGLKILRQELTNIAPVFKASTFLMSSQISILDCAMAPLMHELNKHKVKLGAAIENYNENIFGREAFKTAFKTVEG